MTHKSYIMNGWKRTHREAYLNNKVKYREKIVRRNTELVNRAKARPCMDCGVQYNPWVMDFDHRDPSEKKYNVSKLRLQLTAVKTLEAEILKCDVVCANCHRDRSHKQGY